MTRRERIAFLLDHLHDVCGPGGSSDGVGTGEGPGFMLSSAMSEHPSVIELGRSLDQLRRLMPHHGRAIDDYYGAAWYIERTPKTVKRGGRVVRVLEPDGSPAYELRRRRSVPHWLAVQPADRDTGEPRMVARGVDIVSGLFRGDPFVPSQLLEAA